MKYFFGWTNIKYILTQVYKTLSNEKSFLSSKRLERMSFTGLSEIMILGTFIFLVYKGTLTASDTIILVSPLMIAGGYNIVMGNKDKEITKTKENEGS
jgi:hypothetical protein